MNFFLKNGLHNIKDMCCLVGLTIIIIGCCFSFVNSWVDLCLPDAEVTIEATELNANGSSEIWVAQAPIASTPSDKTWHLKDVFQIVSQNETWKYIEYTEGYSYNLLRSSGENLNVPVKLLLPRSPNTTLNFWANAASGISEITINGKSTRLDLFSSKEGGEIIYFFPFAESKAPLIIRIIFYFILGVCVFFVLLVLYFFLKKEHTYPKWLLKPYSIKNVLVLFVIFYTLSLIYYKAGIPNFLEFGDQIYYWFQAKEMINDLQATMFNIASFRGVFSLLFPYIALQLGQLLNIDPVLIYFIFTNLAAAFLIGYILPNLQEELCGYKAKLYQTAILMFIFLFFWFGVLTAILADFMGLVFLLTFVLFLLKFRRQNSACNAVVIGVSAALAIGFRSAHMYVVIPIFLLSIIGNIIINKKSGELQRNKQIKNKYWIGILIAILSFLVMSIPQIYANYQNDHIGIFSYDHKNAWEENVSVTKLTINHTQQNFIAGYPYSLGDKQSVNIKTNWYQVPIEAKLEINQLLDAYSAQPMDTLVMIGKKLFLALDVKTNVTYPDSAIIKNSAFYLFSIFNYFIMASSFFMLFKTKWSNQEKTILWIAILLISIPQTIIHVEWRYYMGAYMLLYYVFAFKFSRVFEDKNEFENVLSNNYLPFISIFIYISMLLSLTFYA